MENGWSLFNNNNNNSSSSGSRGGHNGHCTNLAWDIWDFGTTTSRFDWSGTTTAAAAAVAAATAAEYTEASGGHALMLTHQRHNAHHHAASIYAGGGPQYHPDPHLMCLKLGKRHYFEDATALGERHVAGGGISITAKKGRPYYYDGVGGPAAVTVATTVAGVVPRCQVEGCQVALVNAKDYHRRHKVCEMHSKAPKVVVLGIDQRFCQQCSRFHAVSEFDESKRSCRRRLAGHNERRRKGSHDSNIHPRIPSQGRAHSLLSLKNNPWFSSADLSSRCSAALRELIEENRAAILARQLVLDRDCHRNHHTLEDFVNGTSQPGSNSLLTSHHQMFPEPHGWDRFSEGEGHVTLDLMQAASSEFGFLSVRGKSKEDEEECSDELWRSLGGAHLV